MSNLDVRPLPAARGGREDDSAAPVHDLLTGRVVPLGESSEVRRLLPNLGRRTVGAWCFVDHYGPTTSPRARYAGASPALHWGG